LIFPKCHGLARGNLRGLYSYDLDDNLIVFNDVGVSSWTGTGLAASCNDVFGNSSNYLADTDPTGTNGNISTHPQYCAFDPLASMNFLLQSNSPCSPGNQPDGYACGLMGNTLSAAVP